MPRVRWAPVDCGHALAWKAREEGCVYAIGFTIDGVYLVFDFPVRSIGVFLPAIAMRQREAAIWTAVHLRLWVDAECAKRWAHGPEAVEVAQLAARAFEVAPFGKLCGSVAVPGGVERDLKSVGLG